MLVLHILFERFTMKTFRLINQSILKFVFIYILIGKQLILYQHKVNLALASKDVIYKNKRTQMISINTVEGTSTYTMKEIAGKFNNTYINTWIELSKIIKRVKNFKFNEYTISY